MKRPLFRLQRLGSRTYARHRERGVTMALVAVSMVAILGIAMLSIDAVTLFLAREEAQRTADTATVAAARILSLSGITGDPADGGSWTPACTAATQVATAVAQQNTIAGQSLPAAQVTVTFPNNPGCAAGSAAFAINPQITVKVTRQSLPTFFARVWGHRSSTISATATAEAFNPSNSGSVAAAGLIPVQAKCVKPWVVPNKDPNTGAAFVDPTTGAIGDPGVRVLNAGTSGVIGEDFVLTSDCKTGAGNCEPGTTPPGNMNDDPPTASGGVGGNLEYVPASVDSPSKAVASCATTDNYQEAIGGCDLNPTTDIYACGTTNGAQVDLTINPGGIGGDTSTATQCLINQSTGGQDQLNQGNITIPIFPFQIQAGSGNPIVKNGIVPASNVITSSNSIVTLPIYDGTFFPANSTLPPVTIVGFLQVFIDRVNLNGDLHVYVLNVAGCSNNAANTAVGGTSPVPIRLITSP